MTEIEKLEDAMTARLMRSGCKPIYLPELGVAPTDWVRRTGIKYVRADSATCKVVQDSVHFYCFAVNEN